MAAQYIVVTYPRHCRRIDLGICQSQSHFCGMRLRSSAGTSLVRLYPSTDSIARCFRCVSPLPYPLHFDDRVAESLSSQMKHQVEAVSLFSSSHPPTHCPNLLSQVSCGPAEKENECASLFPNAFPSYPSSSLLSSCVSFK